MVVLGGDGVEDDDHHDGSTSHYGSSCIAWCSEMQQ